LTNLIKYEPTGFAAEIFKDRYAIHPEESFAQACQRVAAFIASAEEGDKIKHFEKRFFDIMNTNRFSPGGRIWRNAGRKRSPMINCFVLESHQDSREGWGELLKKVTIISGLGGGIGINFGNIRPRGSAIKGMGGIATGAVSLMKIVNSVCDELRSGGARRCLPHNTLIHTNCGLVPIANIESHHLVQTISGKFSQVICKQYTGKKRLLEIDTQMGKFYSSIDHRWAVLDNLDGKIKWIAASNIQPQDRLIFINYGIDGIETKLPPYIYNRPKYATTTKDIEIPQLTTEIAWFLGQLHGDGCVFLGGRNSRATVSFGCADDLPEQHNRIVMALKKFGGQLKVSENRYTNEKCSKPRVTSVQLAQYLSKFKKSNTTMDIPSFILCGTREIRAAYIAGLLDADGYLGKGVKLNPVRIATSIYPDFLRQVRAVLSSLGLVSAVKIFKSKCRPEQWNQLYHLEIVGIESIENFRLLINSYSSKYMRDGIKHRMKEQNGLTVPSNLLRESQYKNKFANIYWQKDDRTECSWTKFQRVIGKRDFQPIMVKSITMSDKIEHTYDIQILDDKMFVAEGLLVHNSALLFGLPYDHPDIEEFLSIKLDKKELTNANISVLVDNKFFDLVESDSSIELKWQGKITKTIKARWLYDKVITNSLLSGDPGFINLGNAEKYNNLYWCRNISCCNPCGEQALPSNSVCCLGSLILSNHLDQNNEIDWNLLDDTIGLAVRFLDDVLEKNEFPFSEIQQSSQQERRIGLGAMGLHDLLLKMGVKYSSQEALTIIDKLMNFIKKKAYNASIFLSVEKGQFPLLGREKFIQSGFCKESLTPSIRKKILEHGIRNCCLLTSPPTGTTSIVAGVSSGIEPTFAPIYQRNFDIHNGEHTSCEVIIHPLLARFVEQKLDYSHFESAHEITPEQHCKVQKICQRHIDSSISKTINLSSTTTKEELSAIILKHIRDLKGVTVYRDTSKGKSPLVPLPLSEVQKYLGQMEERAAVDDCPTGTCDI